MQLRPRQVGFVEACTAALLEKGNTLGVAPTGAGKTVMLSAILARLKGPTLVLQHRDELVIQNATTFTKVAPGHPLGLYTAGRKRFETEGVTFGMVQSVANVVDHMPRFACIAVDEAHHIASNSYIKIIARARQKNPDLQLFGVTATPERGDKRNLRAAFDNVADIITIRELIEAGHLVKPRTFVLDVGVADELRDVKKTMSDFDMDAVARIMDHAPVHARMVEEWKRTAGDRRTVVFAATVQHAVHVCEAFTAAGVSAAVVEGTMGEDARRRLLSAFDRGEIQVVVNVAVLTEGWDCQPVSCVVLLRPSSHKSTMMQMIGRGLRKLDPELYPGIVKSDCVVLDFGTSVLMHGSIETAVDLESGGDPKNCPECQATVPDAVHTCPLCGYNWPKPEPVKDDSPKEAREKAERAELSSFVLTEVDLLASSPYRWEELWQGAVWVCTAFEAWAAVVNVNGKWFTVGGMKDDKQSVIKLLEAGQERFVALATGDDWMREHGDPTTAGRTKRWLSEPPSDKQLAALKLTPMQAIGLTKYRAAALMTWKWSESAIKAKVMGAVNGGAAKAA